MKTKKFTLTIVLMLVIALALSTNAYAYQSISGGSAASNYANNWITNIRKIESENGGMGLKEIVDTSNGLATTDTNNIDVHLQKNTEYGAMVLLGASNYGKRATSASVSNCYMNKGGTSTTGTATDLATSTGNISGVYELAQGSDWEWTAGGGTSFLSNINTRYRDIYEKSGEGKPGDATVENGITFGNTWHGSHYGDFAIGSWGFARGGYEYGVFSCFRTGDFRRRIC